MKRVNNKGFTLVELLVCIAVVAALSIAMGVGASNAMNSSSKADYAATFKEIFKNANIYAETHTTGSCNIQTGTSCSVTLAQLVTEGLMDKDIYNKENPYMKDGNFVAGDTIKITLDSQGYKTTSYNKKSGCQTIYYSSTNKKLEVGSYAYWKGCS